MSKGAKNECLCGLARCAVEVAESGRRFHFSEPAFRRVEIEEAEARHSQDTLRAGKAQVFISPKMSRHDASERIAKQEHVGDEDSIRVSFLETDGQGQALGRRLESLLVRDVPLTSWMAMLKDQHNPFGRAFQPKDETSALSVMELFAEFELAEEQIPDGPIDIVRAVLPYIKDDAAKRSVEYQLERYQKDQDIYDSRAKEASEEWLEFDKALAESLRDGRATTEIRRFINILQFSWDDFGLELILKHNRADGGYDMTRELAAYLEKANRNVLLGKVAIATANEKVMAQMDAQMAQEIEADITRIRMRELYGLSAPEDIAEDNAKLIRKIANQSLQVSGGCSGENSSTFKKNDSSSEDSKEKWEWKKGICRTKNCASRPRLTEVGPCSVCRMCQHIYDTGRDPEKVFNPEERPKPHSTNKMLETISQSRLARR